MRYSIFLILLLVSVSLGYAEDTYQLPTDKPSVGSHTCGGDVQCSCGDTVVSDHRMWYNLWGCQNGLKIASDDITLDCTGHLIQGTGSGYGVRLENSDKSALKNCIIKGFENAVELQSTNDGNITRNKIWSNEYGIYLTDSNKNLFWNNNFTNNSIDVFGDNSEDNDWNLSSVGNFWAKIGPDALAPLMYSLPTAGVDYHPNEVELASCDGSKQCNCGDTLLSSQTMWYDLLNCPSGYGLQIMTSNINLNCNSHLITGIGTGAGILISYGNNAAITNCRISNFNNGLQVSGMANGQISANTISNNGYGIQLMNAGSVNINNNVINNNNRGLDLSAYASNNLFDGNDINSNSYGVYFTFASDNNIFTNNDFISNSQAVAVYGSTNNIFSNNHFESLSNAVDNYNGNRWNRSAVGNWWSDFSSNPYYPNYYLVPGAGVAIDWHPLNSVPPTTTTTTTLPCTFHELFSQIFLAPQPIMEDSNITITANVVNAFCSISTPFYVSLTIDGNPYPDKIITSMPGSGSGSNKMLTWVIGKLPAGLHNASVMVDSTYQIPEYREDNNAATSILTVVKYCEDGIQDHGEEGVDCGGDCPYSCNVPIILVHGYYSDPSTWNYFVSELSNNYSVYTLDYAPGNCQAPGTGCANGDIRSYAEVLQRKVDEVLQAENARRVDLVVHSMGGLVSRWYVESLGTDKVRNLIMIATPNHGSELFFTRYAVYLAEFLSQNYVAGFTTIASIESYIGDAGRQMTPYSEFLNQLNYDHWYWHLGNDLISSNVKYNTLAGTKGIPGLSLILWGPDDGIVRVSSVRINSPDVSSPSLYNYNHNELPQQSTILNTVVDIIENRTGMVAASLLEDSALQQMPMQNGTINQGEIKNHYVQVDQGTPSQKVIFTLAHLQGQLEFSLIMPNGTKLNKTNANNYSETLFTKNFVINQPLPGNWTLSVHNLVAGAVEYQIFSFAESQQIVKLFISPNIITPNYQYLGITAQLRDVWMSGLETYAKIKLPNGTFNILPLKQIAPCLGIYGAEQGNYSDCFYNTALEGKYEVTLHVKTAFCDREAYGEFWVLKSVDLVLKGVDVKYDDTKDRLNITARIGNTYKTVLRNISIDFYDGDPKRRESKFLGTSYYNGSKDMNVSFIYNGPNAGGHNIYAQISPFNKYNDLDYLNNTAHQIIFIDKVECGSVLTKSTKLKRDLIGCNGKALTMGSWNTVLDCDGHSITGGTEWGTGYGVYLKDAINISIKNCFIRGFLIGIHVDQGWYCNIINNTLTDNFLDAAYLARNSQHNDLYENKIYDNVNGIRGEDFHNSDIRQNNITNNLRGIWLHPAQGISIYDNNISRNGYGIVINYYFNYGGNTIWNNRLVQNDIQAMDDAVNFWNLTTGNYWSDFYTNSGFPSSYLISGASNSADKRPLGKWIDLQMIEFRKIAPDVPKTGEDIVFSFKFINNGNQDLNNIYFNIDTGDGRIISNSVPLRLKAGKGILIDKFWSYPNYGTYYPKVVLDPENLIPEYNETNNQMSIAVNIVNPLPQPSSSPIFARKSGPVRAAVFE